MPTYLGVSPIDYTGTSFRVTMYRLVQLFAYILHCSHMFSRAYSQLNMHRKYRAILYTLTWKKVHTYPLPFIDAETFI